jgi:hypothetical protein
MVNSAEAAKPSHRRAGAAADFQDSGCVIGQQVFDIGSRLSKICSCLIRVENS